MAGKSVAERPTSVPDLVRTPSLDIGVEDIALPKIRVAQFMSKAMQGSDTQLKLGMLFASTSADDPDPDVVYDPRDKASAGLLIHILALEKGKSYSDGGELVLFAFNDPSAPPDAWTTYQYTVAVPEVDPDVPHKIMLTRSGKATALKINTVLSKTAASGPPWQNAFRLTTVERSNDKGKWAVIQARLVDATPAGLEAAEKQAQMLAANPIEHAATGEVPAI